MNLTSTKINLRQKTKRGGETSQKSQYNGHKIIKKSQPASTFSSFVISLLSLSIISLLILSRQILLKDPLHLDRLLHPFITADDVINLQPHSQVRGDELQEIADNWPNNAQQFLKIWLF